MQIEILFVIKLIKDAQGKEFQIEEVQEGQGEQVLASFYKKIFIYKAIAMEGVDDQDVLKGEQRIPLAGLQAVHFLNKLELGQADQDNKEKLENNCQGLLEGGFRKFEAGPYRNVFQEIAFCL